MPSPPCGFVPAIRSLVVRLAQLSFITAQLAACASTNQATDQLPRSQTIPPSGLTVVIDYYAEHDEEWEASRPWESLDADIGECVARQISQRRRNNTIIPPAVFRRTAFPNLTDVEAPRSRESLFSLLANPTFRDRISPLKLRYIVVVSGGKATSRSGGIECGAAGPSFACLGLITWDMDANLTATIFDLDKITIAAVPTSKASETAWLAVIGIFPLGLPANPTQSGCGKLGESVAEAISAWENGEAPSNVH